MSETEGLTVFWDDRCLDHEPPAGEFEAEWTGRLAVEEPHPDRPERVRNIRRIIETELPELVTWADVTPATRTQLERVHDPAYLEEFERFCEAGGGRLTAETGANEASYAAAEHAAGAAISAAKHAVEHASQRIPYALARPSGHHAQPAQADGFCFFNNAAVATEHVLKTTDTQRVAILDWDVHHGNGTQECFYGRDDVLAVSAGQDGGTVDPLGRNVLTKDGFETLGQRARELAAAVSDGRLALVQEGGYQISHLAYATLGVLEGVLDQSTGIQDPMAWMDEDFDSARRTIDDVTDHYDSFWPV